MTPVESLIARRDAILTELAQQPTGPDYSIDGQSVQRVAHRKALLEELTTIQQLIIAYQPYEIHSVAY